MPPIRRCGLRTNTRRMSRHVYDVVFINSTADFQKLLHDVSSLVGSNKSLAFEIPVVTYCLYIFVLANRAKV